MITFKELHDWRNRQARSEEASGEKMFMNLPDRWFKDVGWGCENGHVSRNYLKSETEGELCLGCHKRVLILPPEVTESNFRRLVCGEVE